MRTPAALLSHALILVTCLAATGLHAKPVQETADIRVHPVQRDIVGDVDGAAGPVAKTNLDTIWLADWTFDGPTGCTGAGWTTVDNRVLNDGQLHWQVDASLSGTGGIAGNSAQVTGHSPCWSSTGGYDNGWYQGLRIEYSGASTLSFAYVVDSEESFDFMQVEVDSACASFARVDFLVDPKAAAFRFRDVLYTDSGLQLQGQVTALALPDYGGQPACVYISFFADGAYSPADGLQPTTVGVALAVDDVTISGATTLSEDFEGTLDPRLTFANIQESTPFGNWARLWQHATDNDVCDEELSCAWIWSDHTTPLVASDPGMAFGPGSYVVRNWLDNAVLSPWVSLTAASEFQNTVLRWRRFPGQFFSTSRSVSRFDFRTMRRVANTDTPAPDDSVDCPGSWEQGSGSANSGFAWITTTHTMNSIGFSPETRAVQVRLRTTDWQLIAGAGPPAPHVQGPGPYVDRVRIGRTRVEGPRLDDADGILQAQDAFPTEPDPTSPGGGERFRPSTDRFGSAAFSMSRDMVALFPHISQVVVGDSIVIQASDARNTGGLNSLELLAAVVSGPHAGKAPPPWTVGANGFFVVPADTCRNQLGNVVADRYFVDLDDDYFRGGDVVRYLWMAQDAGGGTTSMPAGLAAAPASIAAAEAATGGLYEVNILPGVNWDPGYLARVAADPNGKLEPTATELEGSSQSHCILYYQFVNDRRMTGDASRTSFMYTLDQLGYRDAYDVYDAMGPAAFTHNQLGGRATVEQATGYALIIMDAGKALPGTPILPDGDAFNGGKVDQSRWFRDWLAQAATSQAGLAALWILSSDALQENPADPLYSSWMGASFVAPASGAANPEVHGQASMTFSNGATVDFSGDSFTLDAACLEATHDALQSTGAASSTHEYVSGGSASVVMNANAAGAWNSILMAFPWFEIWDSPPRSPTSRQALLQSILAALLPQGCPGAGVPTDGPEVKERLPKRTQLYQNAPNPLNPQTRIRFDLSRAGEAEIVVYRADGRRVRTLLRGIRPGGEHSIVWDGRDDAGRQVASGIYFYRLRTPEVTATRKMVVAR